MDHYSILDYTATGILKAAYTGDGLQEGVHGLPVLKHMKNHDTSAEQTGLLAWALGMADPIKEAIKSYPVHALASHIKNYQDTEAFIEAFNDDQFG